MDQRRHRVVIVGGGFGGLGAARALARTPADVTVVDRRNFHLFQPLLYQVATGGLSPADIASPIRGILRRQQNTRVLLAEAVGVDVEGRRLLFADGEVPYDTLVVATGVRHDYFGRPEWESRAPGLKTLEDATEIRARVLSAFEAAEREPEPKRRAAWLTFVIVGGGATGVELAGALGEISRHTLRRDFRNIDSRRARILLVEAGERILPSYDAGLAAKAASALARIGVEVRVASRVSAVEAGSVTLTDGSGDAVVEAHTVLWAAGVRASGLTATLAEATGAHRDRAGRIQPQADLTLPGHPEVFVIGDATRCLDAAGAPLPGVAPVAVQQGRHVARTIRARLLGQRAPGAFAYRDPGSMATIGRGAAIAEFPRLKLSGYPAWLAWLFVHLLNILELENRVLVLVQWAWSYATWNRGARLITASNGPVCLTPRRD